MRKAYEILALKFSKKYMEVCTMSVLFTSMCAGPSEVFLKGFVE